MNISKKMFYFYHEAFEIKTNVKNTSGSSLKSLSRLYIKVISASMESGYNYR